MLATVLAVIGIYGVISYVVLQRKNEIGVRMALGADRNRIVRMVIAGRAILISIGVMAGTAMTIASGNAAASMLYGQAEGLSHVVHCNRWNRGGWSGSKLRARAARGECTSRGGFA